MQARPPDCRPVAQRPAHLSHASCCRTSPCSPVAEMPSARSWVTAASNASWRRPVMKTDAPCRPAAGRQPANPVVIGGFRSARTVPSTHRAVVRFPARCQSCRLLRVPPERQRAAHIAARVRCCRVGCCMRPRQRTLSRRTWGLNGLAGLRSCCVAILEINCCCWRRKPPCIWCGQQCGSQDITLCTKTRAACVSFSFFHQLVQCMSNAQGTQTCYIIPVQTPWNTPHEVLTLVRTTRHTIKPSRTSYRSHHKPAPQQASGCASTRTESGRPPAGRTAQWTPSGQSPAERNRRAAWRCWGCGQHQRSGSRT